ncbi:MAG TPA: hypothetical protein VHZ51_13685, partial [Ktedonobacteraceae bacterium]|nr:hypothetical protein [Ktedonobacteraceae bacterium]
MLKTKRWTTLFFLLPMFGTIVVINLWPIAYTLYLSITNYTQFNSDHYRVIGLGNYRQLLFSVD